MTWKLLAIVSAVWAIAATVVAFWLGAAMYAADEPDYD